MSMTVIVTRDVDPRYRGFLTSCALEIAPGVYTAPDTSTGVRERVWRVLAGWHALLGRGSIVMTWADSHARGRQGIALLGEPSKQIVEYDGVFLVMREIPT
jgi:CRISPR-associated protein Cas2